MNLIFDAQVWIGAAAVALGLAAGFFVGWVSRGYTETSLRTEFVRLEGRLLARCQQASFPVESAPGPTDTAQTTVYNISHLLTPRDRRV